MPCDQEDKFGYTPEERGQMSMEGTLCGMQSCAVPPEQRCGFCKMWYCLKHFPYHFQGYPEHKARGVENLEN